MGALDDLIEDAHALRDLLTEHIENLEQARASGMTLSSPLAAIHPSAANDSGAYEGADVLPVGRLRHPAYQRLTLEEGRAHAIAVLEKCCDWVVPLWYAEQHYAGSPAATRYWRGLLQREFSAMHREGLIERGTTGKRGARYKYRLKRGRS